MLPVISYKAPFAVCIMIDFAYRKLFDEFVRSSCNLVNEYAHRFVAITALPRNITNFYNFKIHDFKKVAVPVIISASAAVIGIIQVCATKLYRFRVVGKILYLAKPVSSLIK